MSMREIEIMVQGPCGPEAMPVVATKCGPFAVHSTSVLSPFPSRHRRGFHTWTVTHVSSGYSVLTRIPTKDRAVGAAKKLAATGIDWQGPFDLLTKLPKAQRSVVKQIEQEARA